jgi:hypothetical protein
MFCASYWHFSGYLNLLIPNQSGIGRQAKISAVLTNMPTTFGTDFLMKNEPTNIDGMNLLHALALGVATAGAIASLSLTFQSGLNSRSILVVVLIAIWVIAPYLMAIIVSLVSRDWPLAGRIALYILMLVMTLVSLVVYSGILTFPRSKPSSGYLLVPLMSWCLLGTLYFVFVRVKK